MASLPLRYWCEQCGMLLMKSDPAASALIETVCRNRRCPLNRRKEPRVIRLPEDAREQPATRCIENAAQRAILR